MSSAKYYPFGSGALKSEIINCELFSSRCNPRDISTGSCEKDSLVAAVSGTLCLNVIDWMAKWIDTYVFRYYILIHFVLFISYFIFIMTGGYTCVIGLPS